MIREKMFPLRKFCLCLLVVVLLLPLACHRKPQQQKTAEDADSQLEQFYMELARHPKDASVHIRLSDYFLEKGILDSALNYALKAVRLDSLQVGYYVKLSDLYLMSGKVDLCEDMLLKALRLEDKEEEPYLKLAELYFWLKRYDDASGVLNRVLELNSYNPKAYFIRGWIMREQGDTSSAIHHRPFVHT